MFLMETKRKDEDVFKMYRGTEFTNHFTIPPVGLSGGLALSWKDNVDVEILVPSANVIDTKVTYKFIMINPFLYCTSMVFPNLSIEPNSGRNSPP